MVEAPARAFLVLGNTGILESFSFGAWGEAAAAFSASVLLLGAHACRLSPGHRRARHSLSGSTWRFHQLQYLIPCGNLFFPTGCVWGGAVIREGKIQTSVLCSGLAVSEVLRLVAQ